MADSFFGFDTSVPGAGLDDAIECPLDEDDIVEEDEYDALNDETFGSATDDDWEKNHEKLAQIAESTRLQKQLINHKNGIDVDIEGSFPHLVMDEKDGIVPRPGVWDSPSNFPVVPPNPSLSVALKNVCTVEELERGLRPPPGLQQQHIQQQQQNQLQLHLQHQQSNNQQRNHNRPTYQTNDQSSSNNHNQPFFKNNQNWNQNRNNQRYHHNNYNNYHNGLNENGEYDEYAGMMSNREKQWLINIQLMQHNTNQPYFDDYYFTVFCDRQNKKNNESPDNKDNKKQNKNGYRDRDNKDQSQHILTKVVYTPTQFENSLGKLQCGSVTAPRKIIDMDVVASSDPQQNQASQQKDMKKARQRLLEIERLYTVQLKLEDVNNPLALVAEQQALQQQQQQVDQEIEKPVKKTAPELINIMLTSILQLLKEDKLSSILSIRKGKALLLRFLPFLSVTEYTQQLGDFWVGFIRGLAVISRRDANILIRFFPEFHRWIETVDGFEVLLRLAKGFLDSVNQPNKNNNSLALAVTNKFGVSVLASLLERAETLYPNEDNASCSEWSSFIVTLADTIGSSPPSIAPCQPIPANTLNEHLQRIRGLTIERYAPLESLLTDANLSR
ncbi:GSCOCG00002425001-RA-CDS [Cotesia congregata]|nr:GSCOCG00002425001-RA-CDS [Cotesia congregata]